jgi:hypothetical protein
MREALAAERLRELLHYDPTTGKFIWRTARHGVRVGAEAGRVNKSTGYREIMVAGRTYLAHRLAWLPISGELPKADIRGAVP